MPGGHNISQPLRSLTALGLAGLILFAASCTSEQGSADRTPPPVDETHSTPLTPGLNELERKIVDALSTLDIEAAPAELSLDSAQLLATFEGSELVVSATRTAADRGQYNILDQQQIGGTEVLSVRHLTSAETRKRFRCGEHTFETYGAVPPGFDSFEAFLTRFLAVLDCN